MSYIVDYFVETIQANKLSRSVGSALRPRICLILLVAPVFAAHPTFTQHVLDHFQVLCRGHAPSATDMGLWLNIVPHLPREMAMNFLARSGLQIENNKEDDADEYEGAAFLDGAIWHMFDECERRAGSSLDFAYLSQLYADAVPHVLLEHIGAWCENDATRNDPPDERVYRHFYRRIVNTAVASVRFMDCIFKQLHSASISRTPRSISLDESSSEMAELNVCFSSEPVVF